MSLPVFLLHGLGADHRAFQRFERLLPEEWDIRSLDLLGHGRAPHPEHGYLLDDHAAWIESQLPSTDDPAVLVGHSYGAAVCLAIAARRPDLVKSIVLLDPVVHVTAPDDDAFVIGGKTAQMVEARRTGTLPATVERLFFDYSHALKEWTVETWQTMALGVVNEFDLDWMRFTERVLCPVSIIYGEPEFGGSGDAASDWFDEPRLTCIQGAGHYLHATHARETAAALIDAVNSLNTSR